MQAYRFYVQDFATKVKHDIEADFNCRYIEFKGLLDYEVKNVYTEDYADASGSRVYVPETPVFKSKECTLKLLFLSATAQRDSLAFSQFVQGRMIEYSDDFRGVFVTLVNSKEPTVGKERLYGGVKYREMTYTFTNVRGQAFTQTQIQ